MAEQTTLTQTELIAELNDLLQLDHDAVQAYTVAIDALRSEELRADLLRYRGDHERHIRDLTASIREHGGTPIELPHLPTGVFKLAVQQAGTAGGDREVLLAFKSNEGQVRNKYRRAAEGEHPQDVAELLRRNAADEETHYRWVTGALERMGAGPDTALGRAEGAFEQVHGGAADVVEGAERGMMESASRARRTVQENAFPLGAAVAGLVGLLVLRRLFR